MRKVLVFGGELYFSKLFEKKFSKKYDLFIPSEKELDISKPDSVIKYFRQNKFDAVLLYTLNSDAQAGESTAKVIQFKNIQYASILTGVKKLFILSDASDLGSKELIEADESIFEKSVISSGTGLNNYLIRNLAAKDKISSVLRFFNIYGLGVKGENNEVMRIISDSKRGKKNAVYVQDKVISTVYIEDALKIISEFIDNQFEKGCYNIVSDEKTSLNDIAKKSRLCAKKAFKEYNFSFKNRGYDIEFSGNNNKLKGLMPYLKFTSISSGISKTYDDKKK